MHSLIVASTADFVISDNSALLNFGRSHSLKKFGSKMTKTRVETSLVYTVTE